MTRGKSLRRLRYRVRMSRKHPDPQPPVGGDADVRATIEGEPDARATIEGEPDVRATIESEPKVRATVWVRGRVQGVGFRWWTRARALELGVAGWARNTADGRVEIVAEGSRDAVERLLALLAEEPSSARRPGRVTAVSSWQLAAPKGERGFVER